MNYKLIQLSEHDIIVSNEKIRYGDRICVNNTILVCRGFNDLLDIECDNGLCYDKRYCKKVIAGVENLPMIDYNGFGYLFGRIEISKLAIIDANRVWCDDKRLNGQRGFNGHIVGFIEGFKAAQQLNNKKFSEEDVRKAIQIARENEPLVIDNKDCYSIHFTEEQIIESLEEPKVFNIEVELIEQGSINSIVKITKVL